MPSYVDENGQMVSDDGQVVDEGKPVDFESNEPSTLDMLGKGAALFGNAATFGLVPLITGAISPESKNEMLNYLEKGREDLGGYGTIAELAGGFAAPVPGLGLLGGGAKAAKTIASLGKAGKFLSKSPLAASMARGAIAGGTSAGITSASNMPGGAYDWQQNLKDAAIGAGTGAGLGMLGKGFANLLADRAKQTKFSAGGGTAGTIKHIGSMAPKTTMRKAELKAGKIADTAEREGWIGGGKIGWQTVDESTLKAQTAIGKAEDKIDDIINQYGSRPLVDPAQFKKRVLDEVEQSVQVRGTTSKAEHDSIYSFLAEELDHQLQWDDTVGAYARGPLSARDMQAIKKKIGSYAYGGQGEKVPADAARSQTAAIAKNVISDWEDELVTRANRRAGKQLEKAKELYHHATLWTMMGARAKIGEQGLLEHLGGRGLRSIPDTYAIGQAMRAFGLPSGPISSQLIANQIGRGRLPNAMINLNRRVQSVAPFDPTSKKYRNLTNYLLSSRASTLAGAGIGKGTTGTVDEAGNF